MPDYEKLDAYFDTHAAQIRADLEALIAIPSVRGAAEPNAPFGPEPRRALDWALDRARAMGFAVRDVDGYAGRVDLNDRPPVLGILAHLDVVEAGEGWTLPPYACTWRDGQVYGRGVMDDKGPALIALHALAAVRAAGLPLGKGARLVLGCAEETGSECMAHYRTVEDFPPALFTPDAAFPVYNTEKGRYAPTFGGDWAPETALPRVAELHGGRTTNIAPGRAEALVEGLAPAALTPVAERFAAQTGVAFRCEQQGSGTRVFAEGLGSHAAEPEKGRNALTALLGLLAALPLAEGPSTAALRSLARLFPYGDLNGTALGVDRSDELSGRLTLTLSVLDLGAAGFEARFDSRLPVCATEENTAAPIRARLAAAGMPVRDNDSLTPPHHTPADSPLVRTLNRVYEQVTGLPGDCLAMGGGTYVHGIPGGVAFGCGMPDVDYRIHGADEYADFAALLDCGRMFARVIAALCR